ncbi:unnamed protein product [Ceutorhynchus assimilis]|uniref:Nuclear pore protein n=1 Tax=Ceutorhynchus assimilis TaxID=467358 RepID=A0A9N9MTL8_9CUCU|nr:unnamed protein product [Ceutorhynchus assimilis]
MSDFADLLQEAERLTKDLEGLSTEDLPKVDRSLKQVLEASNDLYARVAQGGSKDIEANLLLGSKGVDLPKIVKKLESLSTQRTFETIEPVDDLDLPNILENQIQNKVLETFDTAFNETLATNYDTAWAHQQSQWKQEKMKIISALSGNSGLAVKFGKSQTVFIKNRPAPLAQMPPNEKIYACKVIEYNTSLVRGLSSKTNLINVFENVAAEFKDSKVKDMWDIIKYMVQLSPFPQSDDPIKARNSPLIIHDLVCQGKKYLQDRYKLFMNNIVNENLAQANRGGVPGTYPLVRSFLGLRFSGEYSGLNDGLIDERPLWPMVYYCLRSGDFAAAIYCLKKSGLSQFEEIIRLLEMKLKCPSSCEIPKLEDNIRLSYRTDIRSTTDPFKRIVWCVLGCCNVTDEHSEVARTADDYLWLKLSLVRVDRDDSIRYNDLQQVILEEYGESHYDAFNQPHLYFQMLALTGQFEAAIEFLARIERFKVHAVHMAIALNELYLIAGPEDTRAPLVSIDPADPKPSRRLNLARLIMIYVRSFEFKCQNEALHYYFFLRNYTDFQGENVFKVCVADLAMETKEYEKILGKVQPDGRRSEGLIDQFANSDITAASIAEIIGKSLSKKGLLEESIDIFDIANDQEEILSFMCTLMSQVVQLKSKPDSLRSSLHQKAIVFAERFSSTGYRCPAALVSSFLKLKDLITFFDLYFLKEYLRALVVLKDLQLIPFREEEVSDRIKGFKALTAEVSKVIPDVLLATMNIYFVEYQRIRAKYEGARYINESSIETDLSKLRQQAKTLTNFAGMLPYRLPGDTNAKLVQMEILMH